MLSNQYFREKISGLKKLLERRNQMSTQKKILETLNHLTEMAVHCKKEDNFGVIITVGSSIERNNSKGSKKEHNPPHAHIWSVDMKFKSRFQIVSENPPKSPAELKKVDEGDMDFGKYGDIIVEWANLKPKRAASENDKTNWEAMRSSWKDIQDIVNIGLKNPQLL